MSKEQPLNPAGLRGLAESTLKLADVADDPAVIEAYLAIAQRLHLLAREQERAIALLNAQTDLLCGH